MDYYNLSSRTIRNNLDVSQNGNSSMCYTANTTDETNASSDCCSYNGGNEYPSNKYSSHSSETEPVAAPSVPSPPPPPDLTAETKMSSDTVENHVSKQPWHPETKLSNDLKIKETTETPGIITDTTSTGNFHLNGSLSGQAQQDSGSHSIDTNTGSGLDNYNDTSGISTMSNVPHTSPGSYNMGSMISNAVPTNNSYDMTYGYHISRPVMTSSGLIPLTSPSSYMRVRPSFLNGTGALTPSSYSLMPGAGSSSFYYDYAALTCQQQAAASFQRSRDSYGGSSYVPSMNMNSGTSNNIVQHNVVSNNTNRDKYDLTNQSPFTCGTQKSSVEQPGGPPVKRPRGRPRKHPLPVPQQLQQIYRPPATLETCTRNDLTTLSEKSQLGSLTTTKKTSRASRCIKSLQGLYSSYTLERLQQLKNMAPQLETAEEYIGIGGPFTRIAIAVSVQKNENDEVDNEGKWEESESAEVLSETVIRQCPRSNEKKCVNLNKCFIWSSLDCKVPVRDLTISRHHMAVLLNDSTVTHPLVRSRVDEWEHVIGLDNCGIVAIRIVSALLPDLWREKFHETRRPHTIARVRRDLLAAGIILPPTNNPEEVTDQELKIYVANHTEGILCCPTDMFNPDWLPDPFIIAALGHTGVVRIGKSSGYYNYPMVVSDTPLKSEKSIVDNNNNNNSNNNNGSEESAGDLLSKISNSEINNSRIEYKLVSVDKLEKHPSLTVPTKEFDESGKPIKVVAQIQDLALGELSFASFLSPAVPNSLEAAMVLYAVGNNEHSAFVKGRNLYIRFKNFPTGPAKLHCSPLAHTGAVLLANGSIWSWTTTPASTKSNDKIGATIRQVEGSLSGRAAVDMVAIGADFMALTSDGVIHEWNCYEPYSIYTSDTYNLSTEDIVIPQSINRPSITQAVEYTPDFQKKLLTHVTGERRPIYEVGRFSKCQYNILSNSFKNKDSNTNDTNIVDSNTVNTDNFGTSDMSQNINNISGDWDFSSEEVLEWHRQQELKARYLPSNDNNSKSSDPVEKVYLTEGVTIILRASTGKLESVPNDLASYRTASSVWSDSTCFTSFDAQVLTENYGHLGKPISANPVVIARMKFSRDLTDEQLRNQLEQMASTNPPPYRLLVSPTAVVVAILKRLDLVEEAKRMLLTRIPVPIAAYDPKLYLEAFTGLSPTMMNMIKGCTFDDNVTDSSEGGKKEKSLGLGGRRSRGRVGRPRGSRAGVRASLSCRLSLNSQKDLLEDVSTAPPAEPETTTDGDTTGDNRIGTRKRNRRQSAVLDENQYFTGFADSDDSEKAWEEALHLMDDDDADYETKRKKKKNRRKKGRSEDDITIGDMHASETTGSQNYNNDNNINNNINNNNINNNNTNNNNNNNNVAAYYQQQAFQQAYNSLVLGQPTGNTENNPDFPQTKTNIDFSQNSQTVVENNLLTNTTDDQANYTISTTQGESSIDTTKKHFMSSYDNGNY